MFLLHGTGLPGLSQQTAVKWLLLVVVSMPAGFRRHLVGNTLKNAGYCNSA